MTHTSPPLALTMGEPAGIGGDIALAAWVRRAEGVPPFVMIDNPERLTRLAARLGLDVTVRPVASASEATDLFPHALPVLPLPLPHPVEPGFPNSANAVTVAAAIERAVRLALSGEVAGIVTNPIHKKVMYQGGFRYPGHTEFLAALAKPLAGREVMMLTCPGLRVVPVSIHVALAQAVTTLSIEAIVAVGTVTAQALTRDFGIASPRLAVAGLNPHAGEGGTMGREDIDIVAPAVERLRQSGIDAIGPLPADTLFHERARRGYDAALCMYHDQALIPLKTIGFDRGVNITLGLPVVRTSPDHGTAFDLAGSGRAGADSLIAALKSAAEIAANRARSHV
ncbi:4-hydroxythreonine-4-phosphate dehydrogenase PdxA [Magnetospirillum molischianum]|uniref:4-hydroxythreonine-4-phosphate dehydrogenase n=1 Tax=Magnetospirillum molischianum DSM 120 TaxID=1150626 RepID=H8FPI6_MAGML|nr:4-hydroxythreonine-4-phosphate dehydrogenase PdxA [Magnetospirillum molischianum]CCG40274.1 4-hydroxythreonine-4-phosphate dehydrogenase (4-(phosphohydroxy)-L-threonine dehydrogenase) [Magnetospirillum molischianum DSM 120]